jgi:drug/metabolite transporter (DMT)-like permease
MSRGTGIGTRSPEGDFMWIFLALLVRLIWASTNAVDQVLSRAHPKHSTIAALVVQYICFLPFAIIACLLSGSLQFHSAFLLFVLGGILGATFALIPYLRALQLEQAYDVVPYLELTPVFLIVFAYLFKAETLTSTQLVGAIIVIGSGFAFSWDFARGHFKGIVFALLTLASFLFALYQYSLSQANLYNDIWGVAACYYFGMSVIGLILFMALKNVREIVIETFVQTKGRTAILALSTNTLDIFAMATLLLAFRYAPTLGHVAALSGIQPLFSFLLAIPLAKIFPSHFEKVVFGRERFIKMALIIFIFFGVYLLSTS